MSVDHQPLVLAAGEGAIWVAGTAQGEGRLSEIDPQNGRVRRSVALEFSDPVALAAGEGAVWVAAQGIDGDAVLRVDPQTEEVTATIPIQPIEATDPSSGATFLSRNEPTDIAAGAGAVSFTTGEFPAPSDTLVWRIDPATNQVLASIEIAGAYSLDIDGSGGVWVTGPGEAVSRVDPATNGVAATIPIPNPGTIGGGILGISAHDRRGFQGRRLDRAYF